VESATRSSVAECGQRIESIGFVDAHREPLDHPGLLESAHDAQQHRHVGDGRQGGMSRAEGSIERVAAAAAPGQHESCVRHGPFRSRTCGRG
jgi:hypothetical protein